MLFLKTGIPLVSNDTTHTHKIKLSVVCLDEQWIVASRNVIVRLHGTSGRDEALLINAHYGKKKT